MGVGVGSHEILKLSTWYSKMVITLLHGHNIGHVHALTRLLHVSDLLIFYIGDAPMVSVENLLSAVRNVVEDIRVATIEVKDSSVQDSLRLRWGKQDINAYMQSQ